MTPDEELQLLRADWAALVAQVSGGEGANLRRDETHPNSGGEMSRDDIIRMARAAGATNPSNPELYDCVTMSIHGLERFAALVAALSARRGEPACPHIRSSGPADRATHWCALAATPSAAPTITYGPPAERAESWPNAPWNPIPPAAPQGEPVKGAVWYDGGVSLLGGENEDAFCAVRGAQRLYLHPPAAPQGEPVAFVCEPPQSLNIIGGAIVRWAQPLTDALPPGTKLYASPPAAPSDEEKER